jgi:N-glycosylase/DNA lyase
MKSEDFFDAERIATTKLPKERGIKILLELARRNMCDAKLFADGRMWESANDYYESAKHRIEEIRRMVRGEPQTSST